MAITKLTATATGKELTAGAKGAAGNSTGANVKEATNALLADAAKSETAVNALIDWTDKAVIAGDTRIESLADDALSVDGQITLTRTEKTGTESVRPVWCDINYTVEPSTAPTALTDFHGIDMFTDIGASSRAMDLSKTQLYPFESKTFYSGTSTLKGIYSGFFQAVNTSTGTVVESVGLRVSSTNTGTGTVNTMTGLKVTRPTNNGTVDKYHGIFMDNITVATLAADNYAIYTKLGKVFHGDDMKVDGDIVTTKDSFSTAATAKDDITPNRHLRVGDYGMGSGQVLNNVDLDDYSSVSRSFSGTGFTNSPLTSYCYVRVTVHDANYAEQWVTGLTGSSANKIHRRVKDNNVWKAWVEIQTA
ncbi:MAG: hypothetical protein GY776_05020 [Alteromonas sp.]|nr:hypothetical protein [Alteromonas sp.]